MRKCIVCDKLLSGQQVKYCSNSCKQKDHYQRVKKQTNTYHSQTLRYIRRKLLLILLKGGRCGKCGYNKNLAALEFHHKENKKFSLDARSLANKNFLSIYEESSSCSLLCSNCHKEEHHKEQNTHSWLSELGDSLEKSNEAKWMNSVNPLNMETLSQALKAFKEGAETSG